MSETRWFRRGGMDFEVEVDSPAHVNLVAAGAEPIVAPDEKPAAAAKRSRGKATKAAEAADDVDTLGDE